MKLAIPKRPEKPKEFELSDKTDLSIDEVVKERSDLMEIAKAPWTNFVLEKINNRIRFLNDRIVQEFLDNYGA